METHLYALCWNEADILEFFFRHYDPWVDRYFIYDDGSTDGSIEILEKHPKVELHKWKRKFPTSFISSQWHWLNSVWQDSKGRADWVVIVDIDEFIFVPQTPIVTTLDSYKESGVTLVPALGFDILSEGFPGADECLVEPRAFGYFNNLMCKVSIFNPNKIENMNFNGGRHFAKPVGLIKFPSQDELVLGHYKYIGFERTLKKQNTLYANLGEDDVSYGFGDHLDNSRGKMQGFWDRKTEGSFYIVWADFKFIQYPKAYIWWRPFTQWQGHARNFLRDPLYMLKRLKLILKNNFSSRKFQLYEEYIEQIYKNPIRQELLQLITGGNKNSETENPVVIFNEGSEYGNIIQCCYIQNVKELPDVEKIQGILESKASNEKKYNKKFQPIAITNSKKFSSNAVNFAKENNVRLVCRKELWDFIASIETD